jgi:hypothetical protein
MSKKVADIIVETLESAGVKHCYGVVGFTLNMIAHSSSSFAFPSRNTDWTAWRYAFPLTQAEQRAAGRDSCC